MILVPYEGKLPQVSSKAFVAPTAVLIGDVIVEDGVSIWFGAVLRGDMGSIHVKAGANVQDNTVVHLKDEGSLAVIGEDATIGHGAILHDCTIGRGAIVGIGAIVLDFAQVGEEAIVAAGSVVGDNMIIPPRHLAAGVPAEVKKEISGTSLWYVRESPIWYHKTRDAYLKQGIGVVGKEGKQ
ncbi:MAG: gamma carbonic anhydrase family protein [Firmicutes bacterium]|nr:gamma carbonic anhydrase family protein [Bacillota bacterium]